MDQLKVKKPSSKEQERAASPCPSHESLRSDQSMGHPEDLKGSRSEQHGRSASPCPSHESLRSDKSMGHPEDLKGTRSEHHGRSASPCASHASMRSDKTMGHPEDLKESSSEQQGSSSLCPKQESKRSDQSVSCSPDSKESSAVSPLDKVQEAVQSNLRSRFQCLREGISRQSDLIPLNEIYTELYITECGRGEINNEHEIRWIESRFRRGTSDDTAINLNDIFELLPGENQHIRTVLTKGVAGIGKTVSVQKFILDWAERKANQDVHLIFPLPFRELNLIKDQRFSLQDLLQLFIGINQLEFSPNENKIIFIFDGLDECRLSLDFHNNAKLCNVTESASVDVLLTNLIAGNLLPSALIWITSRPAAADLIPSECVHRVTEVRGFNNPQKEDYFRKRFKDQSLADRIISHLESFRNLYIMCHIPVFCWISATVLEKMLSEAESGEIPKTLTQMYTHFLIIQIRKMHEKVYDKNITDIDMILKLGKLAFQQLEKRNLIFYEEDLKKCDIDVREASVYSGLCTQIFREESGLFQGKVYCFVHLSVQEHLAALYVYLSFVNQNINLIDKPGLLPSVLTCVTQGSISISVLYQKAVRKALLSTSGHLDLVLRFLLGFSLESNQTLLKGLLTQTDIGSDSKERIVCYIKQKIKENPPAKSINLFHCLNELNDHSLVEEIQQYLKSGSEKKTTLTDSQWSAMVFVLLTSEQNLDVFDLKKYVWTDVLPDEILQRLQPVLEASRTANLVDYNLTKKSYTTLVSVLTSKSSCLRELNLAQSNVSDSGLMLLCDGLQNLQCRLERLKLEFCDISDKGCNLLALALKSNPSHMKELDLSGNKLTNSGLKSLSAALQNPLCKLEKLWMRLCGITGDGCASLALILKSNPSYLRGLNLSGNPFADSGMKKLTEGLENSHCKLEILRLRDCGITEEGCAALASALRSNPSHLRELDLSGNTFGDTGLRKLSVDLENADCNLEMLRLEHCKVTKEGCAALCSALRSNPSHLRELNLGWNDLGDSGVLELFDALKDPNCILEVLRLRNCRIANKCCAALSSTLTLNQSHLRELDLSQNNLRSPWVKMLSNTLEKPDCKLEILRLEYCGLTDQSCAFLASALRSNPSHLRELNLYMNNLGDSRIQQFSDMKNDPNYQLQNLYYGNHHY